MTISLDGGEVVLLDLATRRTSRLWSGPAAEYAVAFRWDGARSRGHCLAIPLIPLAGFSTRRPSGSSGRCRYRSLDCRTIAWSPDSTTLATTCVDRKIYLWDADTGKRKATLEGSTNATSSMRPSTPPARSWRPTGGNTEYGCGTRSWAATCSPACAAATRQRLQTSARMDGSSSRATTT